MTVLLGSGFALTFLWPRRRREWRNTGLLQAFIISLFTEIFGVPLTIYVLASWLGEDALNFGLLESHLWAWALAKVGLLDLEQAVFLVMTVSLVLLAVAAGLLAAGWWQIYRTKGELVTDGLYGVVRHPQYLGLILGVVAFLIQWPTLPTLVMGPMLIVLYVRLAKREEQELEARLGPRYRLYQQRVPGFFLRGSAEHAVGGRRGAV
ncbi:MAG TPA: isoprenylcysteine carboxylmethyltransferase family protein [Candidatus Competibacteraceae bacterium]|nr:isoprenylcysteine carboxylmethyltransferase family protein [Candidatus Competibacteraceae bacterium]